MSFQILHMSFTWILIIIAVKILWLGCNDEMLWRPLQIYEYMPDWKYHIKLMWTNLKLMWAIYKLHNLQVSGDNLQCGKGGLLILHVAEIHLLFVYNFICQGPMCECKICIVGWQWNSTGQRSRVEINKKGGSDSKNAEMSLFESDHSPMWLTPTHIPNEMFEIE